MAETHKVSSVSKLMDKIVTLANNDFEELLSCISTEQQRRIQEKERNKAILGGMATITLSDLDLDNSSGPIYRALVSMGIAETIKEAPSVSLATLVERNFTFQQFMEQHGVGPKALLTFEAELEKLGVRIPYFIN